MLAGQYGNYARYEIEKKFLLKEMPKDLPKTYTKVTDMYLPNSDLRLRIIKSAEGKIISRKLTKKVPAPEKGKEFSIMTSLYLSEEDLLALGDLKGFKISKLRYCIDMSDRRIVIDQFSERLKGLILAEVEFKDEASLKKFEVPDSTWEEVTGEVLYSCGYLAAHPEYNPIKERGE